MAESSLKLAQQTIESEEAKRILPAATLQRLRDDIARMRAGIARKLREGALERALPILRELEERVAG